MTPQQLSECVRLMRIATKWSKTAEVAYHLTAGTLERFRAALNREHEIRAETQMKHDDINEEIPA